MQGICERRSSNATRAKARPRHHLKHQFLAVPAGLPPWPGWVGLNQADPLSPVQTVVGWHRGVIFAAEETIIAGGGDPGQGGGYIKVSMIGRAPVGDRRDLDMADAGLVLAE